jgi:hypothetical protein
MSETRVIREMLRVFQGSSKSYATGHSRSVAQGAEKRHSNRKGSEAGTEYDISQLGTSGKMQTRFLKKKRKAADLLA